MRLGTSTPGVRAALAALPAGSRILDAACGVGIDVVALARRGFDVYGSDASPAMVCLCRERLTRAGVDIPVIRSEWAGLTDHLEGSSVDAILCSGNSLAHAPGEAPMAAALEAFAALLVPGGLLIVDSHHWEVVFAAGERTIEDPVVVERDGVRCRRRYRWRFPHGVAGPYLLDIDLEFTEGGVTTARTHSVESHPFTTAELWARVRTAGFAIVGLDADLDHDRYTAVATLR